MTLFIYLLIFSALCSRQYFKLRAECGEKPGRPDVPADLARQRREGQDQGLVPGPGAGHQSTVRGEVCSAFTDHV